MTLVEVVSFDRDLNSASNTSGFKFSTGPQSNRDRIFSNLFPISLAEKSLYNKIERKGLIYYHQYASRIALATV